MDYQIEYDNENDDNTMLAIGNVDHPFEVTEKNNSAVYCLLYYLARIKKKKGNLIMGGNEEEMKSFAQEFRLRTLSLIAKIYEYFNDKYYNPVHPHLRMKNVDYEDPKELNKWLLVHQLFDMDVYKVDFSKKLQRTQSWKRFLVKI